MFPCDLKLIDSHCELESILLISTPRLCYQAQDNITGGYDAKNVEISKSAKLILAIFLLSGGLHSMSYQKQKLLNKPL